VTYVPIDPPFSLDFEAFSKKEFRAYAAWFHEVLPQRIAELERFVTSSVDCRMWRADRSVESLSTLGAWYVSQIEAEPKTAAEIAKELASLPYPIEVARTRPTARTVSIAMDVGMYFGTVIVETVPGTQWDLVMKSRSFIDYGRPIITGFGLAKMNPVRIALTIAYKGMKGTATAGELREAYEVWAKLATPR
jgi:hypothetical protein